MTGTGPTQQRYRMQLAYDGTDYAGWQIQPNGLAIQDVLQTTVHEITGEESVVHGSGRTDQGVHARGQVAHFDLTRTWQPSNLLKALNARLPPAIRIMRLSKAPADFHARRSAVSKEYRYLIYNGVIMPPFMRFYRTQVRAHLDETAMRAAATILVGRHDFASFTANPNREIASTVRTLSSLKVTRRGREVVIQAVGEGFLYKMVRSLAGHLIRVGEGAVPAGETRTILESKVRTARVQTAAPQGLFLWRVDY